MIDPDLLPRGAEQVERFTAPNHREFVQYDYRAFDGELFSCVKENVNDCTSARDTWLIEKELRAIMAVKGVSIYDIHDLIEIVDYDLDLLRELL
jgi:hypothetical protein